MIGLEWASPDILFFQRTFSLLTPSQCSGRFWPSATPDALGPRNCGHWPVATRSAAVSSAASALAAAETIHRRAVKRRIKSLTLTGADKKGRGERPRLLFGFCAVINCLAVRLRS